MWTYGPGQFKLVITVSCYHIMGCARFEHLATQMDERLSGQREVIVAGVLSVWTWCRGPVFSVQTSHKF